MKGEAMRIQGKGIATNLPPTVMYFQEDCFLEDMIIPSQKPDIDDILDITAGCEVIDYNLIDTLTGVSYEGQQLTGEKLVVSVLFKLQVKYVGEACTQTIHAAHSNEMMKNVFVVLPPEVGGQRVCDLIRRNKFSINCYIEDFYAKKKDSRTLSAYMTYLVDVKFY
ncbi:MAG: hypothetical protein ACRCWY_04365 [Cellulosilyticaceae bacterium]